MKLKFSERLRRLEPEVVFQSHSFQSRHSREKRRGEIRDFEQSLCRIHNVVKRARRADKNYRCERSHIRATINLKMPEYFHFTLREYKSEFHGVDAKGKRVRAVWPAFNIDDVTFTPKFTRFKYFRHYVRVVSNSLEPHCKLLTVSKST